MTKIFLLLNQDVFGVQIKNALNFRGFDYTEALGNIDEISVQINNYLPDVILIENTIENCEYVLRQVNSIAKAKNIQIILLLDKTIEMDCLNFRLRKIF